MRFPRSGRVTRSSTTVCSRFAAACAVLLTMGVSARARAEAPLDEATATRKVCTAGPAAEIARAERLAGEAAVVAAGVLPNPEASVQHQRALVGPAERETILGLSVPLGIGGRRFLLQDAAAARRDEAQATARATLFETALAFREAYAAAVLDEARASALAEQQSALETLAVTLGQLAQRGESAGYALKRQEMQASVHRRLLASMKARAAASRAVLAAWLGEEATLPPRALLDLAGGTRGKEAPVATHPRVEGFEAAARASGIEARAAHRTWIPDITLFAGYRTITGGTEQPAHGFSASLTIPLTMFDHGQGEAARAEASRACALASAEALRRENAARLKASTRSLEVLEASVADLDRAASEAASLSAGAVKLYAAGEATLTDVLDAFRAAEEARLARIDLAEEIVRARLARMRAAGTQFDAALDQACGGPAKGAKE